MRDHRRKPRQIGSAIELLEGRVVPSTMGMSAHEGVAVHPQVHAMSEARQAALAAREEAIAQRKEIRAERLLARREHILLVREARLHHTTVATMTNASGTSQSAPMVTMTSTGTSHSAPVMTSTSPITPGSPPVSTGTSTTTAATTTTTTTMPNAGAQLNGLYQTFEQTGGTGNYGVYIQIQGSNVGVSVVAKNGVNFNNFMTELTNLGMQIQASSATYGNVTGFVPIANLPSISQLSDTLALSPLYKPMMA